MSTSHRRPHVTEVRSLANDHLAAALAWQLADQIGRLLDGGNSLH